MPKVRLELATPGLQTQCSSHWPTYLENHSMKWRFSLSHGKCSLSASYVPNCSRKARMNSLYSNDEYFIIISPHTWTENACSVKSVSVQNSFCSLQLPSKHVVQTNRNKANCLKSSLLFFCAITHLFWYWKLKEIVSSDH